jgi:pyrroline-5-carboxylate reductase
MDSLGGVRIGIMGAGAIGGAVIDRLLTVGVAKSNLIACEPKDARRDEIQQRFGVAVTQDATQAAAAAIVVLAVPPLEMKKVLRAIRDALKHRPLIVSFAAAMPLTLIQTLLPAGTPAVRVNPNSPSLVGSGFNPVVYGKNATGSARALAESFLAALGTSYEVPDSKMNLYTALTAVGPTYFLPVFDALIAAGVAGGLSRADAVQAAVQTALGTAAMVSHRSEPPEQLKLYTGLRPLKDAEVRDLVSKAIAEAASRMNGLEPQIASQPDN